MGGIPLNNKKCYLFFSGYYVVSTASQLLARYQVSNRIVRAPVYLRDSCNFAVLIDAEDEQRSLALLEKAKIALEQKAYTAKTL